MLGFPEALVKVLLLFGWPLLVPDVGGALQRRGLPIGLPISRLGLMLGVPAGSHLGTPPTLMHRLLLVLNRPGVPIFGLGLRF